MKSTSNLSQLLLLHHLFHDPPRISHDPSPSSPQSNPLNQVLLAYARRRNVPKNGLRDALRMYRLRGVFQLWMR